MGDADRGESAFTFLSDVASPLGRATRPLAPLPLSPLTAFTLDRSLPASATRRKLQL